MMMWNQRRLFLLGIAVSAALVPTLTGFASDDTTVVSNSATLSSCRQITTSSFLTDDDDGDGWTSVEFNTADAWPGTPACSSVTGTSPRQCLVPGLIPAGNYYLRFTHADPDGVSGLNPEVLGPLPLPPCGPDQAAPTVTVLSPSRGAIVGGPEQLKIQVFDRGGLEAGTPVQVTVDGGPPAPATVNANYDCGDDCAIFELVIDTTVLTNGSHPISIRATDAAGNVAQVDWPLTVNNVGSLPAGDGRLLRRSHGARLCLDCHDLMSHSSQATSTSYGNWALDCLTCHTPHRTRNIYLIRESIRTPSSGTATVSFFVDDAAGGGNPQMSYLGDYSGAGSTPYDDGVCEVCHTRTNHYRNDASGGDHTHGSGIRCITCHAHQRGFRGGGSGQGHLTHTVEEYGPMMTCESGNLGCHGSQPVPLLSDGLDLAATASCDECHSPAGSYNGVNSVGDSVGAKDNWPDGVYVAGGNLAAGKEKWCVGCHDEVPSLIDGVAAPNVTGDEDGSYRYGTGWGYYKTGHGLASNQSYPSSGGEVTGAGVACSGCHTFSTAHIDGLARTYAYPGTPSTYQSGYRLIFVGGEIPLEVPRDNYCPWDGELYTNQLLVDPAEFRLCFSCHASEPFTEASSTATNFRNDSSGVNAHNDHLSFLQTCGPGPIYHSDWDNSHDRDSRTTCMNCHNVHGSTQLSMVRDGKLVDKEPGLEIAYYNTGVSYQCTGPSPYPPTPPDVTLAESTGTVWNSDLDHLCNDCHGGCGFDQLYLRTTFDVTSPVIENVYGRVGSSSLSVWFSEGVYTNTGATGDLTIPDFSLTDVDNSRSIAGISHNAGKAFTRLTLTAPLDASDDLGTDTLGAATGSSIYDDVDNPMDTTPVTIQGDATPPSISGQNPPNGTTDVAINRDVSFTLSDSEAGVDWTSFSIQLSGDKGYSRSYTDSDTNISKSGSPAAYAVTVDPGADFGTEEVITVTVDVDDDVGNAMPSAVWSFTTIAAGTPQTVTLHPSDVASAGGFSVFGGTWPDILDTNDSDTSYAHYCCSSPGQIFYVDMDDLGLGGVTIQDLTVYVYARYRDSPSPGGTPYAGNVNIGYRTGTSTVWKGNTMTDTSGNYNLIQSATYTTDSDGGALDVADINGLQIAVQRNTTGSTQLRVTEIYVEVTYLP